MTSILETIGNTPLVKLQRSVSKGAVYVKLEARNPGGSVKDRAAYQMIKDLLDSKKIDENTLLIEPTSGNTGVGICMVAAALGIKVAIVMPETMSEERKRLMRAYGAELYLTPGSGGMKGAVEKANELHENNKNSIIVGQFVNPSNPKAHVLGTGPELIKQCEQYGIKPGYFVAGVGTGGTVVGCSKILRDAYKNIKIVAVEPAASPLLSEGKAGPHKIQGIGAGFIPKVMRMDIVDEVIAVENDDAFDKARAVAKSDGLLVGISSGAAIYAATELAKRPENKGKNIVVLLPDTGERYLSTQLFEV